MTNAQALRKGRASIGLAETVEGYLAKVFKGWGKAPSFKGRPNPLEWQKTLHFYPVAGWSDFMEGK